MATNTCKSNDEVREKTPFCNPNSNNLFSCETPMCPKLAGSLMFNKVGIFIFSQLLSY